MPQVQVRFNKINPGAAAHLLAEDEVQTATNLDFGIGGGALRPRRGLSHLNGSALPNGITGIFRPNPSPNQPVYVTDSAGLLWWGSSGYTQIGSGATTGSEPIGINAFRQYTIAANSSLNLKHDGTNITDWIKQIPGKPTITVNTLTPVDLTFGTNTIYNISPSIGGSSTTGTATGTTGTVFQIIFSMPLSTSSVDLSTNGTHTIGDFGVHFVDLAFSDPSLVTRISQDYTVDANYASFWHAEILPQNAILDTSSPDPNQLIDQQLNVGTGTIPLTQDQRQQMITSIRSFSNNSLAASFRLSTNFSSWAVARPDFQFTGTFSPAAGADPWKSIFAVRYIIECSALCTATMRAPAIYGAEDFPLNDLGSGYTWWQTYASIDSDGVKFGESGPGPASNLLTVQNANATVVTISTATGSHGITSVITYRQGGYTQDAYAVHTASLGTATFTDTVNDIQSLSDNFLMVRNLYSKSAFNFDTRVICEPFLNRVVLGERNNIRWSLPGLFDCVPKTSYAQVSGAGDPIQAIIPWTPGLIIVNNFSVYEFTGNNLESGDFQLQRSSSRHGSVAARVPCKTPHGIPLLGYDGLSMYIPGSGNEQEIPWLMQTYGDMFRGAGATDPATLKGNRIPAINRAVISKCSATYAENRLYLAAATGSDVLPQTVFVIDFQAQSVWWYDYQNTTIGSLYWDAENSRILAGAGNGEILILETGTADIHIGGTSALTWSARTKDWSANSDTVLENLSIEADASNCQITGVYDSTNTTTVGTLTSSNRTWSTPALNGTFVNDISFKYFGQGAGQVYQMSFDLLPEPVRVNYYRTPYDTHSYEGDKHWDVTYIDLENRGTASGVVSIVSFIDGTAVMTNTIPAPWTSRQVFEFAYPNETYGRVAYNTLTSNNPAVQFQVWTSAYDARNEPAKINTFRTDIESLEENICDGWDVDINPGGTCTGTVFVDGTAVRTSTFTGTRQQSYTTSLPQELYGRTIYALYSGGPFKHYKTWFHLRLEPDRWVDYVTSKFTSDEHEWKVWKPEMNCFGNTVLSTVFVDGNPIGTYTSTSSVRHQDIFSLPIRTFGRTIWAAIHAVSGVFKYYPGRAPEYSQPGYGQPGEFEGDPEPPRVTLHRTGPFPFPSSHYMKTWLPELDPLGGVINGTLLVDDVVLATASFTGDRKQWFTVGLDVSASYVIQTGSRWEAVYSGGLGGVFKHYDTKVESEPQPFGKTTWAYDYRKLGGASQTDIGRYFSVSIQTPSNTTAQYFWDLDGTQFTTGTLTLSPGEQFIDRIPLPPGMRGYLFQFRFTAASPVKVSNVNLDLVQEGIKNLTRRQETGTPQDGGPTIGQN